MVEGLKLWAERFEIEQEQRENEVRVWLKHLFILLCRIESHQFTARVFKIAFMFSRDGEFMTLEEFDYIAVYLNHIHKTPLSESGPGGPSQLSKGLFLLEVKGSVNPSKPAFFKAEI